MENGRRGRPEKEVKPLTPEQILRRAAKKYAALQEEADNAVFVKRDNTLYEAKMRESGREIALLHSKIQEAVARGQTFPDDAMFDVEFFSREAQRYLDTNFYGLSAFLIRKGTKNEEQNSLEELINKLYPPKKRRSK